MAGDKQAFAASLGQIRRMVEASVLAEIRADAAAPPSEPFPSPFVDLFSGVDASEGWFDLFVRDAAERLKDAKEKDGAGAFEKIWNAEQTALIKAIVEAHSEILIAIQRNTEEIRASQDRAKEDDERRHRELLDAIARERGVPPEKLAPLFEHLGMSGLTLDEMRRRAEEAVEGILAKARQKVEPSNEGADIDATIGAARERLGNLDTAGARSVLAAKIAEEETVRRQRLIPLLEEKAAVERLSYDHEAADITLRQLLVLDPDRVWTWIELGDLWTLRGSLAEAEKAFRSALQAALANGDARDLSVSHNKLGDVQVAQGNLAAALTSFQASLAIAERLAKADPGNAGWQRDLSVSHDRLGDVQVAQGKLAEALTAYRDSLAIASVWPRRTPATPDGSAISRSSYDKLGDVLVAQGKLPEALTAYRDSLAIRERLAKADPGNAGWQRDLSVSHDKVGDVQVAQGNLAAALTAYDSLAVSPSVWPRPTPATPDGSAISRCRTTRWATCWWPRASSPGR